MPKSSTARKPQRAAPFEDASPGLEQATSKRQKTSDPHQDGGSKRYRKESTPAVSPEVHRSTKRHKLHFNQRLDENRHAHREDLAAYANSGLMNRTPGYRDRDIPSQPPQQTPRGYRREHDSFFTPGFSANVHHRGRSPVRRDRFLRGESRSRSPGRRPRFRSRSYSPHRPHSSGSHSASHARHAYNPPLHGSHSRRSHSHTPRTPQSHHGRQWRYSPIPSVTRSPRIRQRHHDNDTSDSPSSHTQNGDKGFQGRKRTRVVLRRAMHALTEEPALSFRVNTDDDDALCSLKYSEFKVMIKVIRASNKYSVDAGTNFHGGSLRADARWVQRHVGPHIDVAIMILHGVSMWRGNVDANNPARVEKALRTMKHTTYEIAAEHWRNFLLITKTYPLIHDSVRYSIRNPDNALLIAHFIGFHAKAARSTDFGTLRPILWRYIPEVKLPGNRVLQALTCEQYQLAGGANLGFKSACTARLLVPIDLRTEFDESDDLEEFCSNLEDGMPNQTSVVVRNNTTPGFLFPAQLKYDAVHPHKGYLKGELVLAAYKHIFTGPNSAMVDPGESKATTSLSRLHGLTEVVPEHVAYIATAVRYLLHTHREWKGDDKDGSHSIFFGQITKFLNGEKEELTSGQCDAEGLQSNVLAWFNKEVYGGVYGGGGLLPASRPLGQPAVTSQPCLGDIILASQAKERAERQARRQQSHHHDTESGNVNHDGEDKDDGDDGDDGDDLNFNHEPAMHFAPSAEADDHDAPLLTPAQEKYLARPLTRNAICTLVNHTDLLAGSREAAIENLVALAKEGQKTIYDALSVLNEWTDVSHLMQPWGDSSSDDDSSEDDANAQYLSASDDEQSPRPQFPSSHRAVLSSASDADPEDSEDDQPRTCIPKEAPSSSDDEGEDEIDESDEGDEEDEDEDDGSESSDSE